MVSIFKGLQAFISLFCNGLHLQEVGDYVDANLSPVTEIASESEARLTT